MRSACRTVILASGSGSNFQALIDDNRHDSAILNIVGLITDKTDAFARQRATKASIEDLVVSHDREQPRSVFDAALATAVEQFQPDLVILAGFMKIISGPLIERYQGRILNIHPALLPRFKGLNTHQRCLDAGDHLHGSTVHFVTANLDDGPGILQAQLGVDSNDTAATLSARVQALEHKIYPIAARWFAEHRVTMQGNQSVLDGLTLDTPIVMTEDTLLT